ncbi:MAG: hypothetical protein GC137_06280 [Alphaproteobacteria bacterium]|nr:hypothetical protein [Alphaproteobacteria bacterium]
MLKYYNLGDFLVALDLTGNFSDNGAGGNGFNFAAWAEGQVRSLFKHFGLKPINGDEDFGSIAQGVLMFIGLNEDVMCAYPHGLADPSDEVFRIIFDHEILKAIAEHYDEEIESIQNDDMTDMPWSPDAEAFVEGQMRPNAQDPDGHLDPRSWDVTQIPCVDRGLRRFVLFYYAFIDPHRELVDQGRFLQGVRDVVEWRQTLALKSNLEIQ